jgi:hypothetical protein
MQSKNIDQKYKDRLSSIPAPGNGCHTALLGVANLGASAGMNGEKIFLDIRNHIPQGTRHVSDREIHDAVCKAIADHSTECCRGAFIPKPQLTVKDGKMALQRIINQAIIRDEADLWDLSPIRLWEEL